MKITPKTETKTTTTGFTLEITIEEAHEIRRKLGPKNFLYDLYAAVDDALCLLEEEEDQS